jgi:hypothetical protein
MDMHEELRELDIAEIDAVSGGMTVGGWIQNTINMVHCVLSGGDWSDDGVSTVCAGPAT